MPRQQNQAPFFDHGVSARDLADQPSSHWSNHRKEPSWSDNFTFISATRIREFLTDNVDENADHFVFFTSAGTVLGHDRNHTFAKCRRFAAFAGFTFLAHDEAFARTGKPSANKTINDGMFNAKVLKYVVTSEKKLRALIVEQEGIVSAVVYCKQRTLMAAQLGKDQSSKELADGENGLARQVHDVDVGKGDAITMDAPDEEGDLAAESDNENDSDTTEPTDEGDSELGNTQNDGPAENGASEFDHNKTSRRAERASGPTKLQILQWRAEGMAESLAENELKDFIMPPDFH